MIAPQGCPTPVNQTVPSPANETVLDCPSLRGGIFHSNASKTWIRQGEHALGIEENLSPSFHVAGYYGLDTVSLGSDNSTKAPSLDSQIVAGVIANIHYTGMFGLRFSPTNLSRSASESDLSDSHPSYLTSLKTKNMIPSLSWAYTAGASYRKSDFRHCYRRVVIGWTYGLLQRCGRTFLMDNR